MSIGKENCVEEAGSISWGSEDAFTNMKNRVEELLSQGRKVLAVDEF
ncbi:hypothetical protein [Marinomonas sp. 2405UD68-3]